LSARAAIVILTEGRNLVRLEREPPIIPDHHTDYTARAFLDAIPFCVLGRLYFPPVDSPRYATVSGHRVRVVRKCFVVCFIVGAAHG
jgi:hypothetical protein